MSDDELSSPIGLGPTDEQTYHRHTVIQWPDPTHGPWAATVHWREIDGRLECIGLNIWHGTTVGGDSMPDRTPTPITATNLREARLHDLLAAGRRKFVEERLQITRQAPAHAPAEGRGLIVADRRRVKRAAPGLKMGRPSYSMDHWERVAAFYREAYLTSPNPTADVALEFSVNHSTAAKWVARCRKLQLLPKTTQGKSKAVDKRGETR